jgi:hypothetical protein
MNKNIDEIKNYFDEDVKTRIREMSNEDMKNAFRSLEGTEAWFAILKYISDRTEVIKDSLLSLDPTKEASKISQYQGIASGIWDLPDAVLNIKFASKKAENPQNKEEEAKNELGGAYGKY